MAGIVFYPRYFEMFNLVVEEWFEQVVGVGYYRLHADERIGIPMVRMVSEFNAMSRLEDVLDFTLTIKRLGDTSINCFVQAVCGDEIRCSSDMTMVCVDLDSGKKRTWPKFIRSIVDS